MKTAEQLELTECWECGYLHFDPNSRCPKCNAGLVKQCDEPKSGGKFTALHIATAYENKAQRYREQVNLCLKSAAIYRRLA